MPANIGKYNHPVTRRETTIGCCNRVASRAFQEVPETKDLWLTIHDPFRPSTRCTTAAGKASCVMPAPNNYSPVVIPMYKAILHLHLGCEVQARAHFALRQPIPRRLPRAFHTDDPRTKGPTNRKWLQSLNVHVLCCKWLRSDLMVTFNWKVYQG